MPTLKLRGLAGCGSLALAAMLTACVTPDAPPAAEAAATTASDAKAGHGKIEVSVLSSRYDLVSGGDALVEIKASEGARASDLRVTLNGRNLVTPLKFDQPTNTLRGLVSPLDEGGNWLQVTGLGGYTVSQPLVNHPAAGPVVSGPHIQPFECRTKQAGLGDPVDENCSAETRYDWFYKSTAAPAPGANGQPGSPFKPLDNPRGPNPADLAMTTTIDGRTLPYIVRVESGTNNRFIYRIAVLDDPATEQAADGWNSRLALTFGGGCGTNYNQGTSAANGVLSDLYLARGFAYATSSGLANQLHCNGVLQGETAMMLKEHFIEAYGAPKWTVGTGGSGGAIQQLLIAEMYPGVLDGLQPSLAFPDSALHTPDCGLLQHFFKSRDGKGWSDEKKAAVTGFYGTTCASWERSFVPILDVTNKRGCGLSDESLIYDRKKNPKGARCTITDHRVNIYGRDPKTGFARKPDDNVGLQYGLKALNDGAISVNEFLSLNEKVGGNDIDGAFVAKRSVGDPAALKAIYESGLMNTMGGGLKNVPVIDYRWYSDSANDIHSRERDLTIRARLENAYGRSDNQVIWVAGPAGRPGRPGEGGVRVDLAELSLDAMTKWLDAIAADPAPLSTDKVVRHKPAEALDAYWTADGKKMAEKASWDNSTGFNKLYPVHLEPRIVAGAPVANDIMKCQLKPVDMGDYKVKFTKAQEQRLKKVFPEGVCDWSKPDVNYSRIKGAYQKY